MKILHISALPVWSMDGKGGMPSLRETLKGHIAAGHTIELILPKYNLFSDDLNLLFVPEQQEFVLSFAACRWLPLFKKFRIYARKIGKDGKMPYGLRWLLNVFMLLALTISLGLKSLSLYRKGFHPQIVYAHNQYAALSGFLLGCLWRIPNVTRLYGTFLADLMNIPLVSLRYPTAVAGFLVPSSLLICANDGTRGDEVARRFRVTKDRFRFWQNGIEPPSQTPQETRDDLIVRFGSQLRKESIWVVSCSRLASWKRIDRILEALTVCNSGIIDCQLIVVGDGPRKENLRLLAHKLGVSNQVVWLGAVAHDDVWAIMNNADVFMITNDVTNRCNPLYEAVWAGLPIVSISDPSTADLLHHRKNALLANKDDTTTLGECLAEICCDNQLREKFSNAQKELASSFWTWEERMRVETQELEKLVSLKETTDVSR